MAIEFTNGLEVLSVRLEKQCNEFNCSMINWKLYVVHNN